MTPELVVEIAGHHKSLTTLIPSDNKLKKKERES